MHFWALFFVVASRFYHSTTISFRDFYNSKWQNNTTANDRADGNRTEIVIRCTRAHIALAFNMMSDMKCAGGLHRPKKYICICIAAPACTIIASISISSETHQNGASHDVFLRKISWTFSKWMQLRLRFCTYDRPQKLRCSWCRMLKALFDSAHNKFKTHPNNQCPQYRELKTETEAETKGKQANQNLQRIYGPMLFAHLGWPSNEWTASMGSQRSLAMKCISRWISVAVKTNLHLLSGAILRRSFDTNSYSDWGA